MDYHYLTTLLAAAESHLDLATVFKSCPFIYTTLIALSIAALSLWLYSFITLKTNDLMPPDFMQTVRKLLSERHFESALETCQHSQNFCAPILATGLLARRHGPQVMMDMVQLEGRRRANSLWQRISLLNEIAVIAPMIGLLGTVLGLFLAFYDSGHSAESLASIFDGFGIAVGTTVVGLMVAILSMIFYVSLKYRVVRLLSAVENESLALISLVEQE